MCYIDRDSHKAPGRFEGLFWVLTTDAYCAVEATGTTYEPMSRCLLMMLQVQALGACATSSAACMSQDQQCVLQQQEQEQRHLPVQDAQNVALKGSSSACDASKPAAVANWPQQPQQTHTKWSNIPRPPENIPTLNGAPNVWESLDSGAGAGAPQGVSRVDTSNCC